MGFLLYDGMRGGELGEDMRFWAGNEEVGFVWFWGNATTMTRWHEGRHEGRLREDRKGAKGTKKKRWCAYKASYIGACLREEEDKGATKILDLRKCWGKDGK
ncbi:MAG TPA: hypothetical protein VFE58_02125 [Tepidisphaeraceae bacterium]|jgi:hypothetical protein|nr:hypothetical protein [Tepidisphaeraceae bacterium]